MRPSSSGGKVIAKCRNGPREMLFLKATNFPLDAGGILVPAFGDVFAQGGYLGKKTRFRFWRASHFLSRGSGSFVHFASMYGVVPPDPSVYQAPMIPNPIDYGASKAGILQMNRYLAVHYGSCGLRFNCVAPGPFPNPSVQSQHPDFVAKLAQKTPLNRIGMNTEIVGPVLFLLTDSSAYMTG